MRTLRCLNFGTPWRTGHLLGGAVPSNHGFCTREGLMLYLRKSKVIGTFSTRRDLPESGVMRLSTAPPSQQATASRAGSHDEDRGFRLTLRDFSVAMACAPVAC